MPLAEPVVGLFTDEWDRFSKGWNALSDAERVEYEKRARARQYAPDGSTLISIPGWSEIVHTSTPYQPQPSEVTEFYRAKRSGRPPDLPAFVTRELQRRDAVKERIARSPEPGYAQAFGSILTALDNVQDFMSTLATTGRLSLWAGERVLQAVVPGASQGTARALGEVAARRAAAAAAAEFAETVAARAAAGNLVARLALNDAALYAVARREAIDFAASRAFKLAFDRALLGLAGRFAARFIPVLGWIVLASDLLNLLSFLAMLATPAYALLCGGPQAAIAAGVPAALFKQALKRETWRAHNLNPFSRQARAARVLRSAGRLPAISNLLEVAQTTDTLFGVGLSLGGLVGLLNGLTFGAYEFSQGRTVRFAGPPDLAREAPGFAGKDAETDPALRRMLQIGVNVAVTAPAVQRVQDVFTEDEHLLVALAHWQALALLRWASNPEVVADAVPRALDARWGAPLAVDAATVAWAQATGRPLEQGRRWWFGPGDQEATGRAYVEAHALDAAAALRDFLGPRRNAPVGTLYGAVVDETWQTAWLLAENDPHLFHLELTPDARLVSSFAEEGFILAPGQAEARVWRWWLDARARLAQRGSTGLSPEDWQQLADRHAVAIIPLLASDQGVPAAWAAEAGSP